MNRFRTSFYGLFRKIVNSDVSAPIKGDTPLIVAPVVARLLPGVRSRLMAMLLASVVPLFGLAAAITWQSYREVETQDRAYLVAARVDQVAQAASLLAETERWLRALAKMQVVRGGTNDACAALLRQVVQIEDRRYVALAILDRTGNVRCTAARAAPQTGPDAVSARLLPAAALTSAADFVVGDPVMGSESNSLTAGPVLPTGLRVADADSLSGAILATVSLAWLVQPALPPGRLRQDGTWLIDSKDRVVPVGDATVAMLPPPETLARLKQHPSEPLSIVRAGGVSTQFVLAPLTGNLQLLIGMPATRQMTLARQHLFQRLLALGLIMLSGLAVMALGADSVVVRPLRQLSLAVVRWREGGAFKTGSLAGAPREIAGLSQSFSRAVAALGEREAQLREAGKQQELLMQEIHHRVKNNLQIVASLLNLQASRIKLPEAKAEFQAARDRIRALATLHRHLYAHGDLHTINMRSFLVELCSQLLQALGETPAGRRITLDIEAPELQISSDQAVPLALIVTESVSNSAKYAFPGGRSGHILVCLTIEDEGSAQEILRLVIEDDGVGIPSGRADTEAGVRDGIGTHLIRGFARQLQATITLTQQPGTRYVIEIPLHRVRGAASVDSVG